MDFVIKLLPNKRFSLQNKCGNLVIMAEHDATSITVGFPDEYENYSKRVDFLTAKNEGWTEALYVPELKEYPDGFDKSVFTFELPNDVTYEGELRMQFVAYKTDGSMVTVPWEILPLQVEEGITRYKKSGSKNPDLIVLAVTQSTEALFTAQRALNTANQSNEQSEQAVATANEAKQISEDAFSTSTAAEEKSDQAVATSDEAKEIAENALQVASQANETSDAAETTADEAKRIAESAVVTANTADGKADQAVETADEAKAIAESADVKSDQAIGTADEAKTIAENALAVSGDAKSIAEDSNATAAEANDKSDNAVATADAAKQIAENAVSTADTAERKADQAVETADEAKAIAEGADAKSDQAISTADAATSIAEESLSVSNEAKGIAEASNATAADANDKSDSAISTANDAKQIAENALSTAEQISDNALAVAEEAKAIAETAEGKADTANEKSDSAIETADAADEKADTAIIMANTANAQATTAIETANTATTAAQQAQTVAAESNTKSTAANSTALDAKLLSEESNTRSTAALSTAESAVRRSDEACTIASRAETTAQAAELSAHEAEHLANTANLNASTAMGRAEQAVATANLVNGKVNTALEQSQTAVNTAFLAEGKAADALEVAESAESKIDDAVAEIALLKEEVVEAVESKVDKEPGKGLSTNDYTDAEKEKLANIEEYILPDTVMKYRGLHNAGTAYAKNDVVKKLVVTTDWYFYYISLVDNNTNPLPTSYALESNAYWFAINYVAYKASLTENIGFGPEYETDKTKQKGIVGFQSNTGGSGYVKYMPDVFADSERRLNDSRGLVASNADLTAITLDSLNGVPTTRKVNNKALSQDITLNPTDIGAEPAFAKNTAFNKNFGTASGTVCQGNDSRLSDARVANGGNADTVDGNHATDFATAAQGTKADNAEPAFTKNTAFNKNFGTAAGTVCQGNDSRLSDARAANGGNADTVDSKHAADFATAAQGTKADGALPIAGGTMTGNLVIGGTNKLRGNGNGNIIGDWMSYSNSSNRLSIGNTGLVPTLLSLGAYVLRQDSSGVTFKIYDEGNKPSPSDIGAATAAQGTKADNAVPTSRTVNGKALTGNITITASDITVTADTVFGSATNLQTLLNNLSQYFTGARTATKIKATTFDTP